MNRRRKRNERSRGSALLVSLMVMVGLSLLGLGFVVISETENNISVNERNYVQTLAVAEAGARLALEWFQAPQWADDQDLLPPNHRDLKTLREVTVSSALYEGYYKCPSNVAGVCTEGGLLFDKPHRPASRNRFFGTPEKADVIINASTTVGANFLADVNAALFADLANGQITDIRIYAPPVIGGTINTDGFWEGGTRYGLATIQVTAEKITNGETVARRVVRQVISEWPFPGPQGPVQSNANISTGGNFDVHWGKMTSEGTMDIKLPWVGIPWFDAWNSITFENGYFQAGKTSTNKNLDATELCTEKNWLYTLLGVGIEDPWYQARAKGAIVTSSTPADVYHPYKFDGTEADITAVRDPGYSNWFQLQDQDQGVVPCGVRDRQLVIFPKIDYDFWKNLSQSASTTNTGVKYLRWVSGENYTDGVSVKNFAQWVNSVSGAKPGFYFFDSQNGLNPQGSAPAGILAPEIALNSADDGNIFLMKGFIYLNVESFGTTGINGPDAWYNFPGEPYRDVGFRMMDTDSYVEGTDYTIELDTTWTITGGGLWAFEADGVTHKIEGAGNGEFNYQDLNKNGVLDIFVAERTVTRPTGETITSWFPVEWFPGCKPGFNGAANGANCSEPHEPYLNLIYPKKSSSDVAQACCGGGGRPNELTPGWENPAAVRKLPKEKNAAGTPIACNTGAVYDPACTSNGYDQDGPLSDEFGGNSKPMLDGVLYNEGGFKSQGNANYFGSILINGNIVGTGTAEVWFDEFLIKGKWQDKFTELPRVYVTAHETEQ